MTEKILIAQIVSSDRIRKELGDIDSLKESLLEHGLLQPIGVRPSPTTQGFFQIIWGGRRFEAATQLGWEDIECKILNCEEDYELREKELEENIRRKDMTWQEQSMAMYEIHDLKVRRNAIIGDRWGYRETGQLLGISIGNVSYTLEVAKRLRSGDEEITVAPNLTEALRILIRRKEAELHEKRIYSTPAQSAEETGFSQEDLDIMAAKPAPEASEAAKVIRDYRVHITSEQPKNMRLFLSDSTVLTEPVVPGFAHYLFRILPHNPTLVYLANISSFFVVKSDLAKADHSGFVPSLKVFGYSAPDAAVHKGGAYNPGMQPYYSANCNGDEMLHGEHSIANAVWRTVLPGLVKAGDKVYVHSDIFNDAIFALIMMGCEVWVADFVNLESVETAISKYGIQLNKEDHRTG